MTFEEYQNHPESHIKKFIQDIYDFLKIDLEETIKLVPNYSTAILKSLCAHIVTQIIIQNNIKKISAQSVNMAKEIIQAELLQEELKEEQQFTSQEDHDKNCTHCNKVH